MLIASPVIGNSRGLSSLHFIIPYGEGNTSHLKSRNPKKDPRSTRSSGNQLALRRMELHDFVSAAHPSLSNRIESFRSKGECQSISWKEQAFSASVHQPQALLPYSGLCLHEFVMEVLIFWEGKPFNPISPVNPPAIQRSPPPLMS